ncbi:MAG: hypothetical protein ACYDA1_02145 [Vulcanimicrobiaceae bacterium]
MGTLQRYGYTYDQLPQHGGKVPLVGNQPPITVITGFHAVTLTTPAQFADAALDPIGAQLFGPALSHLAAWPKTPTKFHWEYPGVHVMSGGEMTLVTIQTAGVPTYVAMAPMIAAHTEQYIVGTMTPTPNPEIVAPSPLTFRAPIAAAQNATVSELNYGNRTTNPAQVYTLNNGCNGFAVVNPGSPVVPVTSGSGAAMLTIVPVVTPMPNGASCSVAVTDNTPQTQSIGVSVGPTYPLQAAGQAAISFSPGAIANMSVGERNYDVPPNGAINASILTPSGTPPVCGNARIVADSLSTDGTYTASDTVQVTFLTAGLCVVQFRDRYNQVANAQVNATQPMQTWPVAELSATSGSTLSLAPSITPMAWVNHLLGGGTAQAGTPGCHVFVFKASTDLNGTFPNMSDLDANDPGHSGYATDANGCLTYIGAPATNGVSVIWEPSGASATYNLQSKTCTNVGISAWNPATATGPSAAQALIAGAIAQPACTLTYTDGITTTGQTYGHGLVGIRTFKPACTPDASGYCQTSISYSSAIVHCVNVGGIPFVGIALLGPGPWVWTITQYHDSVPIGIYKFTVLTTKKPCAGVVTIASDSGWLPSSPPLLP